MVKIDKTSSRPYYEQLVLSIKEDILNGIITSGEKIPSVREMAKELLMNPNTVSKAYKVLEEEQILVTVKGKGTFVRDIGQMPRDQRRIKQLQEQFKILWIEAQHLQVTKEEIECWLQKAEKDLGGTKDEIKPSQKEY
ncbi:MAG TPA: GntR family transcriptional regulator [Tetragenococcus sp.]|nr:GntR family transcriptional regulator [Tetragenococcus sp.]